MYLLPLLACVCLGADEKPAEVKITKDVVYTKAEGVEMKLDLALPSKGDGPFPLVVCVHGGGWQFGNRGAHTRTIQELARNGYAAATISYRLAPKYRYPAHLDDARAAVRFLRANAKKYNLDPGRVAALGDSAGGHLSLLLALMDDDKGGDKDGASCKVQAVVNFYGPTDFPNWTVEPAGDAALKAGTGKDVAGLLVDFLGTSDRKEAIMAKVSPIAYIDAKDPPVLTFNGTVDPLVPVDQARRLHAALKKAGVTEQLVEMEKLGHGWGGKDRERTDQITREFLDKHLKAKR